MVGSDETTVKGETTFRWLLGGFFLEQRMSLDFLGTEIESLEVIGYDPETGTFPSTVFSNLRNAVAVPVRGRWRRVEISVSHGPLNATFTGSFDEDGEGFRGVGDPTPAPTKP